MSKYQFPPADFTFTKFIGVGHELCTVGYCVDEDMIHEVRVTNSEGYEVSSYMSDADWAELDLDCYTDQLNRAKAEAYELVLDRGEQNAFDRMFAQDLSNLASLSIRRAA